MNSTAINFPPSLHFPIEVTSILVEKGDRVAKHAPLFSYAFYGMVAEDKDDGSEVIVKRRFVERYECPVQGIIDEWHIHKGQTIEREGVQMMTVIEPCSHPIQYGGLCGMCGENLTQQDYTGFSEIDRAPMSIDHNNVSLTVSSDEASRMERETTSRLLKEKKLSLIVDLDQTVIHATVDPTVGKWMRDTDNENHNAVKDVSQFQLREGVPGFMTETTYYIKCRPGLQRFLARISEMYELHIYTMGTKPYAQEVTKIIDPTGKYFGDRVLSRDESGSVTRKCIERLFPFDNTMVVIIDDRADVWSWSANLIKVPAFEFFVGIGDINAGFLPQKDGSVIAPATPIREKQDADTRPTAESSPKTASPEKQPSDPPSQNKEGTFERLITSDPNVIAAQEEQQTRTIEDQKAARPLEKQQEAAQKADQERRGILRDDDQQLVTLEQALTRIHEAYFETVRSSKNISHRGRKRPRSEYEDKGDVLNNHRPDVKSIISLLKAQVLRGVRICFSGVIPLGTDPLTSELGIWASSFGAKVTENLDDSVTHLIAGRTRTVKVKSALTSLRARVVSVQWLLDSISIWQNLPVDKYLLYAEFQTPKDSSTPIGSVTVDSPVDKDVDINDDSVQNAGDSETYLDDARKEVDEALAELSDDSNAGSGYSTPRTVDVDLAEADKHVLRQPISPLLERKLIAKGRRSKLNLSQEVMSAEAEGDDGDGHSSSHSEEVEGDDEFENKRIKTSRPQRSLPPKQEPKGEGQEEYDSERTSANSDAFSDLGDLANEVEAGFQ